MWPLGGLLPPPRGTPGPKVKEGVGLAYPLHHPNLFKP